MNSRTKSRTCGIKFKDFQAPVLFSSTFKALNLGEKNSNTFKDFQGCVGTLHISYHSSKLYTVAANVKCKQHVNETNTSGLKKQALQVPKLLDENSITMWQRVATPFIICKLKHTSNKR